MLADTKDFIILMSELAIIVIAFCVLLHFFRKRL